MRLFACRHGERIDQIDDTWCKKAREPWDPPLSAWGREQVRRTVEGIRAKGVGRIVASPLRRTVESADIASRVLGMPFDVDDGLVEWQNELWFPSRTTGNAEWLRAAKWWSGLRRCSAPLRFPESVAEAEARCVAAAQALARDRSTVTLLIVHQVGVTSIANALGGQSLSEVGVGEAVEIRRQQPRRTHDR